MANNYRKGIKRSYFSNIWLRETRKQVANFAKAFGMRVIAWSHNLNHEECKKINVEYVES